ncbi:MAG TPA: zinc-ribbon domain-containing protein [Methylomirabilota bacterium]|jgi:predicted Zn finger-like uncharacterized protein|nr:zinc-ribbon domain-containing protein [Methylomirabilota bacterium]
MTDFPIQCPSCGAQYLLPPELLGAAGASVRCPTCAAEFVVDAKGRLVTAEASEQGLRALARGLFDELTLRLGTQLEAAARERRLFADHGPALMEAWDEFRRRAGARAPSQPFRDELRERFGVELFPPGDA